MTDNPTAEIFDILEHLTSPRTAAVLRIQHETLASVRAYLTGAGRCQEVPLPIIGPVTDPGARGAKQADVTYYGANYKVMTSAILYKQTVLLAANRIFYIAPNVRLEPLDTADTSRHLAEFRQIDVEIANSDRDAAMDLAEELVRHVVRHVISACTAELRELGRDLDGLKGAVDAPFARRSHSDVVAELIEMGHPQNADGEIEWANERAISARAFAPFFVTDYPKGSRGFYDREMGDSGVLANFDLIAPDGYGEISSGSERENDYPTLVSRIRESAENPQKYDWYIRAVRHGVPPSAGFGIGLERLVRWISGVANVWQATAFPKIPGKYAP